MPYPEEPCRKVGASYWIDMALARLVIMKDDVASLGAATFMPRSLRFSAMLSE
jgi:hypothetical protein